MLAVTSIMRSSSLSGVSTFVLYTSRFIKLYKQKPKMAQYSVSEGQFWAPNPNTCTVKQLFFRNRSE
jgi:hypothetical protein